MLSTEELSELKARIKHFSHQAAELSRQAGQIPIDTKENRKRNLDLMRQARDASKQCQVLIQELKKQQAA